MKTTNKLFALGVAALLALSAAGCGSSSSGTATKETAAEQSADTAAEQSAAADTASGKLGNYEVSILDAEVVKDYEGNPALVVSYEFTNNSDKEMSFMVAISAEAYQNGVELENAIILDGSAYDAQTQMKNVKKGGTLTVQTAYVLDDSSPVTIEASELFNLTGGAKLTKVFNLD